MANSVPKAKATPKPERLPITVEKPTPYIFDLGHLLALDPNPISLPSISSTFNDTNNASINAALTSTARDGVQCLLNQLLTTCPITATPCDGILLTLPPCNTHLPRFKALPTPKLPTKWELFARKKGIGKYSKKLGSGGGSAETEWRKKSVYDEQSGEWVPKWGYKGKNKQADNQWLVEVDEKMWKKEEGLSAEGKGIRGEGRRERLERIRRNERRMRANERRAGKGQG
ncbi:regulator of ribosome biosynthesis [Paracoccidioides lutzii Pb01]|uniref:Ribosome biogenesis regulatory protein n=1 Tax=Paracoccidioides lutzii (strain ATCC MYA-826 / Pb01) TaxID=502779 RepID=C1HDX6_PARBA|nr:regulator of ribosome biosynthesis [Paracoccidioides lutzii Pb01]EEH40120.1 regulator of ribosome biosynthesis [Paracoccidioides lutzii Pb01]